MSDPDVDKYRIAAWFSNIGLVASVATVILTLAATDVTIAQRLAVIGGILLVDVILVLAIARSRREIARAQGQRSR